MTNKKWFGPVILLLTAIIWGSAFVAQRAGMNEIEPLTFTAARMILSALALGIPALILGIRDTRKTIDVASKEQLTKKK